MAPAGSLHERVVARVDVARNADGGFGPRAGAPSEPEPTALAAMALDDDAARAWLVAHQHPDGAWGLVAGPVVNHGPTALGAIACKDAAAAARAVDHLLASPARALGAAAAAVPMDVSKVGWGWTADTFGWVEPTARTLVALALLRPGATDAVADGVGLLADRECVGGGWNYGNRIVWGTALEPYAQTTAWALLGLQGGVAPDLFDRGLAALDRLWPAERGGLSLSLALAAHAAAAPDPATSSALVGALADTFERSGFLGDTSVLAWAALATGPTPHPLVVGPR